MKGRIEEWCMDCWRERKGKVKPKQATAHKANCFVCGKENYDAIYVAVEPKEVEVEEDETVAR